MRILRKLGFLGSEIATHESLVVHKLTNGELNARRPDVFVAYVAACICGWTGRGEHPPTKTGKAAALSEWRKTHVLGAILPEAAWKTSAAPARKAAARLVEAAQKDVPKSHRALVGAAALWRLSCVCRGEMVWVLRDAINAGVSWVDLADALGTSPEIAREMWSEALADLGPDEAPSSERLRDADRARSA